MGQSSWGPTVFAIVGDENEGQEIVRECSGRGSAMRVKSCVTQAANHGVTFTTAARS